jgi:hypothetical protein
MKESNSCPVCGYPSLIENPRTKAGGGSYEICPSCGFQFGVSDDDLGLSYSEWRKKWRAGGMKWSSTMKPPRNWNAEANLARILRRRSG